MSPAAQQPEPDPGPEQPRSEGSRSHDSRPGAPEGSETHPPDEERRGRSRGPQEHEPRIDPARLEVRARRIALLLLVLVPLIYFIVQSLR